MKSSMHTEDPQKQEQHKRRHFSFRINLFFFCTFLLFSVLIVRLAILQFVEGKKYAEEESFIKNRSTKIAPIRGNIFDNKGVPLAYTVPMQSLFFRIEPDQDPDFIINLAHKLAYAFQKHGKKDQKEITAADIILSMDLGYDINKNKVKLPSYYNVPRKIKSDLSKEEIAFLLEHRDEYKWLEVTEESIRTYETEEENKTTIATQLIGYLRSYSTDRSKEIYQNNPDAVNYLDTEAVGFDGIERMYQDVLRGTNGSKTYPVDALERIIGRVTVTKPEKGNNLILTINKDVQLASEHAITDQLAYLRSNEARRNSTIGRGSNAKAGYAVAMEVKTGNVVAMASMPDYDVNVWTSGISSTEEYNRILPFVNNGTIRTAYADYPDKEKNKHPSSLVFLGSTIKPLTVLIGLNEGFFGINTPYNDVGSFSFGRGNTSRIQNSSGARNGMINSVKAIEVSSNTFMSAMIGIPFYQKYGGENPLVTEKWAEYMAKFGLGVKTGSGLPFEYEGSNDFIKNAENDSYQSAMVFASWGQNEKYTTLQLAQFTATLASRGKRMKPQFVQEIRSYEGEVIKKIEPEVLEETEFPDAYWDAVIKGMKSSSIGIAELPYTVARKTGTSTQDVSGGKVDNAVFIAFAPAEDPVLAVAVVVPEGGYGKFGASPIAAKIFEAYDKYSNGALSGNPARFIEEDSTKE
ncbi:peptidoglycan D,D-transpeptidase FtsI family protein [Paenibacillus eucommiae]|uniref:Penicillin-binding protein 2 n=1 Tax=Paenibacillus eucommiae TaxID=1355755 RepID=A0ABS4IY87_9BACL|nr:penicillin-binding transpeptidase domain-containing protein [Paenibacillus eucommiae]MBP1992035.1 penicillin-binding protein 2 [Paenibacillus eucommiae]